MTPSGRTAVITGAARGLGHATAQRLLHDGYRVAVCDLDIATPEVDQLLARFPDDRVLTWSCDVRSDESVDAMMRAVMAWSGRIDALVANAGIIHRGPSEHLSSSELAAVFDVNVAGAFRCARAAFGALRAGDGASIVVVGSIGSVFGMPQRAAYTISKSALLGLVRTLATEWGSYGIRANGVAPGFVETVMMRSGLDSGALDEQAMLRRIPLDRLGAPSDVAAAISFLCSPDAGYVNGVLLPVDGGLVIDGTFS